MRFYSASAAPRGFGLFVEGLPVAKARAQTVQRDQFGRPLERPRSYTPEESARYARLVRQKAALTFRGREPLTGPVTMRLELLFPIPVSWSKRRVAAVLAGELAHISKPDVSNLAKQIEDALNGIVYVDDSQIVESNLAKGYATEASEVGAYIDVEPVTRTRYTGGI